MKHRYGHLVRFDAHNGLGEIRATDGRVFSVHRTGFDDTAVPRAALHRGEFVHATAGGVSGGGVRNESFYGESWIPQAWLEHEFADRFEFVASCFDPARYDQIAYVLRKRA